MLRKTSIVYCLLAVTILLKSSKGQDMNDRTTTEQEMPGEEEPDYVMGVVGAVFGLVLFIVGVTLTIAVCVIAASRRKINSSTQQNNLHSIDNPTYGSEADLDTGSVKSCSKPIQPADSTQDTDPTHTTSEEHQLPYHVYETVSCDTEDESSLGVSQQTTSSSPNNCPIDTPTPVPRHDYETVPNFHRESKLKLDNYDHLTKEAEELGLSSEPNHPSVDRNSKHLSFSIPKPPLLANYDSLKQREGQDSEENGHCRTSTYSTLNETVHGYAVLQVYCPSSRRGEADSEKGGTPEGEYSHLVHHYSQQ